VTVDQGAVPLALEQTMVMVALAAPMVALETSPKIPGSGQGTAVFSAAVSEFEATTISAGTPGSGTGSNGAGGGAAGVRGYWRDTNRRDRWHFRRWWRRRLRRGRWWRRFKQRRRQWVDRRNRYRGAIMSDWQRIADPMICDDPSS
jgi:hypothetical protein